WQPTEAQGQEQRKHKSLCSNDLIVESFNGTPVAISSHVRSYREMAFPGAVSGRRTQQRRESQSRGRSMATANVGDRQEYTFPAEIKQLLYLLSHSLYQSREIAVRELISNASDALDKMRYVSLTDESQRDAGALEVVIEGNEGEKQLIIRDTGIGMTHDELVANLGTIARSGSAEFLKAMTANSTSNPDVSLIGQFGVGFYSAFMVADRVRVRTRSYQEQSGWEWESDGSGSFTVTPAGGDLPRGTEVILHLKDDAKDFAAGWR